MAENENKSPINTTNDKKTEIDYSKKLKNIVEDISGEFRTTANELTKINTLVNSINNYYNAIIANSEKAVTYSKQITSNYESLESTFKKLIKSNESFIKSAQKQESLYQSNIDKIKELGISLLQNKNINADIFVLEEKRKEFLEKIKSLNDELLKLQQEAIEINKNDNLSYEDKQRALEKVNKAVIDLENKIITEHKIFTDFLKSRTTELNSTIEEFNRTTPDAIKKILKETVGLTSKFEHFKEQVNKTREFIKSMSFKDLLLSGAALTVGITLLYKQFKELYQITKDISKNLTLTAGETAAVTGKMLAAKAIAIHWGLSNKELGEATKAIGEMYGNINKISADNIAHVSKWARGFGITAEEATKLYKVTQGIYKMSSDETEDMIFRLHDATGATMDNIAKMLAENASMFYRLNSEGLERSMVVFTEFKKHGVDLLEIFKKLSDDIFNIEGSLKAAAEAQSLLNTNTDLMSAKLSLNNALMNQNYEAAANILREMIPTTELTPIQMRAYEKLLGMKVEDIRKMQQLKIEGKLTADEIERMAQRTKEASGTATELSRAVQSAGEQGKTGWGETLQLISGVLLTVSGLVGLIPKIGGLFHRTPAAPAMTTPPGGDITKSKEIVENVNKQGGALKSADATMKTISWANILAFGAAISMIAISVGFALKLAKGVTIAEAVAFSIVIATLGGVLIAASNLIKVVSLKDIALFSLAMGIFGLALIPLSYAISNMKALDPRFVASLTLLFGVFMAFSALFTAVPMLAVGAALFTTTFALFSGGLILLGIGINMIGTEGINNLKLLFSAIPELSVLASKAAGLALFSYAIVGFSMSLITLAGALALLTPLIGVLTAVTGGLGELFGGGKKEKTESEILTNKLDIIINKLDTLIERVPAATIIEIDGREFSDVVGKTTKKYAQLGITNKRIYPKNTLGEIAL